MAKNPLLEILKNGTSKCMKMGASEPKRKSENPMQNLFDVIKMMKHFEASDKAKEIILDACQMRIRPHRESGILQCPDCDLDLHALRIRVPRVDGVAVVPYCDFCHQVFDYGIQNGEVYEILSDDTILVVTL